MKPKFPGPPTRFSLHHQVTRFVFHKSTISQCCLSVLVSIRSACQILHNYSSRRHYRTHFHSLHATRWQKKIQPNEYSKKWSRFASEYLEVVVDDSAPQLRALIDRRLLRSIPGCLLFLRFKLAKNMGQNHLIENKGLQASRAMLLANKSAGYS